jgi:hypothetical protein
MTVEQRIIVGAADQEKTAIVTIPVPAGGEVEIDPTWRFVGWSDNVTLRTKRFGSGLHMVVEVAPPRRCPETTPFHENLSLRCFGMEGHEGDHIW